jgi:hypothetical protein
MDCLVIALLNTDFRFSCHFPLGSYYWTINGKRSTKQMAKVRRNEIFSGMSGTISQDHYVRTMRDGRTIISLKPDFSNRQFSEAQLRTQGRIRQAAAYARAACRENPIYGMKAKGTAKNAYNMALADWMNPPVIRSMDAYLGDIVRVNATDDVQVTRVIITVLDPGGQPLEQGDARLELGIWWVYRPAHQGRIRVEACDLAENVVQREFDDPWIFNPLSKKMG